MDLNDLKIHLKHFPKSLCLRCLIPSPFISNTRELCVFHVLYFSLLLLSRTLLQLYIYQVSPELNGCLYFHRQGRATFLYSKSTTFDLCNQSLLLLKCINEELQCCKNYLNFHFEKPQRIVCCNFYLKNIK